MSIDERIVRGSLLINAVSGTSIQMDDPIFLHHVDEGLMMRILRVLVDRALAFFLLACTAFAAICGDKSRDRGDIKRAYIHAGYPEWGSSLLPAERANSSGAGRLAPLAHSGGHGSPVPFGLLLERWELMRLPELINVLRGNLALVGVKPLTMEEIRRVDEAWQRRRERIPPASQVCGTHLWGQTPHWMIFASPMFIKGRFMAGPMTGFSSGTRQQLGVAVCACGGSKKRQRFTVTTPKSHILDVTLQE